MDADRRGAGAIWRSIELWNRLSKKHALDAKSRRLDQRTGDRGHLGHGTRNIIHGNALRHLWCVKAHEVLTADAKSGLAECIVCLSAYRREVELVAQTSWPPIRCHRHKPRNRGFRPSGHSAG